MTPKLKKIILTVLIIGILFIVYALFIKKDPTQENLVSDGVSDIQSSAEAQILGSQIAQALLRIEKIKLDKSIFSSEIYKSLQDRSQPIIEEPIGRPDPFAPLGAITINSAVRTSTSTTATSTRATSTRPN